MGMKKYLTFSFYIIAVVFFYAHPQITLAQDDIEELTIKLRRNFGYGGIGNDIQGLFTINASGIEDLNSVNFYLDEQLLGTSTDSPFSIKFNTDDYELGKHIIYAVGVNSIGVEFRSNQIPVEFVSAQQGWKTAITIIVVVLGLTLGGMLVSALLTGGLTRRSKTTEGAPPSYGFLGGAVCSNCNKPYSRHIWGLNVGVGKLDRCSHCKKWGITRRATTSELIEAEKLLVAEGVVPMLDDAEQDQRDLDREIEESKYID